MVSLTARAKRFELRLPVNFSGQDAEQVAFEGHGRSLDVSGAGLRLETRHRLEIGMRLLVELPLPEALRPHFGNRDVYRVRGVVRRVDVPEGGALFQVGVQFTGEVEDEQLTG